MSDGRRRTTAVWFPLDVHAALKTAATERDVSMNYLVVRAVREFLDSLIPADEWKLTR
jgi:predicted HicB family RNase H-like nuclease